MAGLRSESRRSEPARKTSKFYNSDDASDNKTILQGREGRCRCVLRWSEKVFWRLWALCDPEERTRWVKQKRDMF